MYTVFFLVPSYTNTPTGLENTSGVPRGKRGPAKQAKAGRDCFDGDAHPGPSPALQTRPRVPESPDWGVLRRSVLYS